MIVWYSPCLLWFREMDARAGNGAGKKIVLDYLNFKFCRNPQR